LSRQSNADKRGGPFMHPCLYVDWLDCSLEGGAACLECRVKTLWGFGETNNEGGPIAVATENHTLERTRPGDCAQRHVDPGGFFTRLQSSVYTVTDCLSGSSVGPIDPPGFRRILPACRPPGIQKNSTRRESMIR
jgi:hypothetical protein